MIEGLDRNLPCISQLMALIPSLTELEIRRLYGGLGVHFKPDGVLDLQITVYSIAREITRRGSTMPDHVRGHPILEQTWFGKGTFSVRDIDATLFQYDIEVAFVDITRAFVILQRKGIIQNCYGTAWRIVPPR